MKCTAISFLSAFLLLCVAPARAVTFEWATVGNSGNADDTHGDGFGGVDHAFRISKHEVTNAQYTEFLNAVDPTGDNALMLYRRLMSLDFGGIENSGTVDGARYIAQAGREQNPVTFVSFFDAMRFVNWLHNGQGSGDTESGVYTIGTGTDEVRSTNAKFWIPNEDEWYKAAYYDPTSSVYYDYPTGTDTDPYSDNPASLNTPDDTNVANFAWIDGIDNGYHGGYAVTGSASFQPGLNYFTDVGAYAHSASPYGTFDQGGNVYEWTEAVSFTGRSRVMRGGSWNLGLMDLRADVGRDDGWRRSDFPTSEVNFVGFRVASAIPEPSGGALALLVLTVLLISSRRSAYRQ